MFDQQLAIDLSASGGLGLASVIERQISMSSAVSPALDRGLTDADGVRERFRREELPGGGHV